MPTVAGSDQLFDRTLMPSTEMSMPPRTSRTSVQRMLNAAIASANCCRAGSWRNERAPLTAADYKMVLLEPSCRSSMWRGTTGSESPGGIRRFAEAENSRTG